MKNELKITEERIMNGLKDFQQATVERVFQLYNNGRKRVLVADEVGLGKTLVAKGLIAKLARSSYKDKRDGDVFKVVYICSNQNIASQNINKLKINENANIEGIGDTRLSMQHLKIFEQKTDPDLKNKYVHLIPITPQTSFSITSGCGIVYERALIFAILKRIDLFKDLTKELEVFLTDEAKVGWKHYRDNYEERVVSCNQVTNGEYLETTKSKVRKLIVEADLFEEIENICHEIRNGGYKKVSGNNFTINKLRLIFSKMSVDLLEPNLVIMDEFQRFKFLISEDLRSEEEDILVKNFLEGDKVRVLMLSATPYKLYSTLEEINESREDEHYSEFLQVVNFLFNDADRQKEFKEIWSNFSIQLREKSTDKTSIIEAKRKAEDKMYTAICRTERYSAVENADFVDDSSTKKTIEVSDKDILSYIEAEELLRSTVEKGTVPVDYVKSSPYLLSFMRHYKLKKEIEKYFENNPREVNKAYKKNLWIDGNKISTYEELDERNARLEELKRNAFEHHAEMLLWIPPSIPYYKPQGVFEEAKDYSKILVFSAWEMVPRMISSLVSYEAERKTVGDIIKKMKPPLNNTYFTPSNQRFPDGRLYFNYDYKYNTPNNMTVFCLLYPSKTLAELYNPIESLNKRHSLAEIEEDLTSKIIKRIEKLKKFQVNNTGEDDERWYYLAPFLLDERAYVDEWLGKGNDLVSVTLDKREARGTKGFNVHLDRLREYLDNPDQVELGKMPTDLVEVLVQIALASPAVCAYRSNGHNSLYAAQLSKVFINMFNKQEATSIVKLCYGLNGKKNQWKDHWKNVLSYCRDGSLQAVLDEYIHMLTESHSLENSLNKHEIVHKLMMDAMQTHSASYRIDTFDSFKENIKKPETKVTGASLRTHFAVSFYKDEGESEKGTARKENIRNSFNSPFRPFVLATTSIGQEGLDFHFYCRRIMHWNLPSNPVDLEQREGRINRFKCHAIRQNIARKFEDMNFENDIWSELFDFAQEEYGKEDYSDLIPFWSLPGDQKIKIERLVPLYPLSKDIGKYHRLIKILSLYRLTLGQPRQQELVEHILKSSGNSDNLEELFVNLSPYFRARIK